MQPRKAAIAEHMLCEIYTLHFDINTPPGHPSKIEEYIVKGWIGQKKDTIKREYTYERDKLVKVIDNEFGGNSTYVLTYDDKGRHTLIDQQTPNGSFHKDTFEYYSNGVIDAMRHHFMFNKTEEILRFNFYGNTDSLLISSTEGPEICYFRELNDTLFITRIWRDYQGIVLSNKVETYDKKNRLVRITFIEKGRVDRTINFTYDDYGNQLSRVDQDVDNIIGGSGGVLAISTPDAYRTIYEYDSLGNWIKKRESNTSGKYNAITTRKIIYKQ